jgi:putative IMPACT (imprinted ancient) family translation regulator
MTIIKPVNILSGTFETKLKQKGSIFICQAFFAQNIEECENILSTTRKKYFDATHHCYAFKLITGGTRYSDNGEPNGTAGVRILNAIEHFDLNDLIVIVTRYYGGTKLGVGPLGKAYYESTFNTLLGAGIIIRNPFNEIIITTNFDQMGHIFRILSSLNTKNIISDYKENSVEIRCFLHINDLTILKKSVESHSRGDINITSSLEIVYL